MGWTTGFGRGPAGGNLGQSAGLALAGQRGDFNGLGTLVRKTTGLKLQSCVVVILDDTPLNVKVDSG